MEGGVDMKPWKKLVLTAVICTIAITAMQIVWIMVMAIAR